MFFEKSSAPIVVDLKESHLPYTLWQLRVDRQDRSLHHKRQAVKSTSEKPLVEKRKSRVKDQNVFDRKTNSPLRFERRDEREAANQTRRLHPYSMKTLTSKEPGNKAKMLKSGEYGN